MNFFKSAPEPITNTRTLALKAILGTLLLGGLLAAFTPSAQATLIGQTVGCSASGDLGPLTCSSDSAVVKTTGPEFVLSQASDAFPIPLTWDIDIEASSIRISFSDTLNSSFNGPQLDVLLSDLVWLGSPDSVITGFLLSVSRVTGFDEADISFFDNGIGFDLGGQEFTDWRAGSYAVITLITENRASVAVPEPATLALFGLGLAGLGFARRGNLVR